MAGSAADTPECAMLQAGAALRSVGLLLAVILPVGAAHADPAPLRLPASLVQPRLAQSLREARAFMQTLHAESRRDAERIRELYASHSVPFADRAAVRNALARRRLVQLPEDGRSFNIAPRLTGDSPIGEMDMAFQPLYLSAHPAVLGCLMHVAARVRTAAVDVTSLVRHVDYQHALRRTNVNAAASLSTHTLGMAFDLSVLNQSPAARRETRDVLRRMRDDGDLLFVAEQRQLVFHVVPHPDRYSFYEAVFYGMTAAPIPRFTPRLPEVGSRPRPAQVRLFAFPPAVTLNASWWLSGCVTGLAVLTARRPRRPARSRTCVRQDARVRPDAASLQAPRQVMNAVPAESRRLATGTAAGAGPVASR